MTITGPVGVGKSALAATLARKLIAEGLLEEVCHLELDPIDREDDLRSLLHEHALLDATRATKTFDQATTRLVVLDNCEGVLGHLSPILSEWLEGFPELSIVTTSTQAFGLREEKVRELAPLGLNGNSLHGTAADFLLDRIRQTRSDYQPSQAEAVLLVQLIHEVDGLPLALELCAPRIALMGPGALLHRLRQTRSLSQGLGSDALERSLAGAWRALEKEDQHALARLTVFEDSFDFDAARAVLQSQRHPSSAYEVVTRLRASSWLAIRSQEGKDSRLTMLGCIRRFVLCQSPNSEIDQATKLHALHYASLVAAVENRPGSRQQVIAERHNLDVVLTSVAECTAPTRQQLEPALQVLIALYWYDDEPPPLRHLRLLQPILSKSQNSGSDPSLICRALIAAGKAHGKAGNPIQALRHLAEASQLAKNIAQPKLEAEAQLSLAIVLVDKLESNAAMAPTQRSLQLFIQSQDLEGEARALLQAGKLERALGDKAAEVLERSAALFRELGDPQAAQEAAHELAWARLDAGQHREVTSALERFDFQFESAPHTTMFRRLVSHDSEQRVNAQDYRELADAMRAAGNDKLESVCLALAALCCVEQGNLGEAHALLRTATTSSHPKGELGAMLSGLTYFLDSRVLPAVCPPTAEVRGSKLAEMLLRLASDNLLEAEIEQTFSELEARSIWARLLRRCLKKMHEAKATPPQQALMVGALGRWFRVPGKDTVSLVRRKPISRILAHLVSRHQQSSDNTSSWQELQAAGWPDQRLLPEAGAHRVRVAISTLRKLGLGDLLETRSEGYCLGETLPLRVVDGPEVP